MTLCANYQFFGRQGGTSPRPWDSLNVSYDVGDVRTRVDENRARIAVKMGVSPRQLYSPKQVHGVHVIQVHAGDDPVQIHQTPADAIWTEDDNIAVGVQTADCVPVLFASQDGRVVGAIHAGWRGAVAGIVPKTISQFGDCDVVIGPCIGFDSYEVGPEVIEAAKQSVDLSNLVKVSSNGKQCLDLAGLIERQLQTILPRGVEIIRRCTFSEPSVYFSHRASKGAAGRQMSVIVKRKSS